MGVAGLAGGACLTRGAAALCGRMLCICCGATGGPGCWASTCCFWANDGGGGGGVAFATTCLLATAAGGAATRFAALACAPITDWRAGGTAARELTGALENCRAFTATADRATGCALANACCGTAVTPPCTFRFTYVTLLMVVLLLTMVVL